MRLVKGRSFTAWCLVAIFFLCLPFTEASKRYVFASKKDCDRHSLDAVYYEKFEPITEDILADTTEFVTRASKLIAESLLSVMADLPGRKASDRKELEVHRTFEEMRRRFTADVNRIRKNITAHWKTLLSANYDLLLDNDNSTIESVRGNVSAVFETYEYARHTLDDALGNVVSPLKAVVRNGLASIVETAKSKLSEANATDQNSTSEDKPATSTKTAHEVDEDELREKVKNVTTDIVPAFLGKVTLAVLERRVDLQKKVEMSPEDRDSALDDLIFDLLMIRSRINSLSDVGFPVTKDKIDLSRRNIYMFWSDTAEFMYHERKKGGGRASSSSVDRKDKYRKIWSNEEDLAETLINLMQVYP